MRVLAAPDFTEKVKVLDNATRSQVAALLSQFESMTKDQLLARAITLGISAWTGEIYIANAGTARVFFSFGRDGHGEYILLVDILERNPQRSPSSGFPARRDPRVDGRLNPNINGSINPYIN